MPRGRSRNSKFVISQRVCSDEFRSRLQIQSIRDGIEIKINLVGTLGEDGGA